MNIAYLKYFQTQFKIVYRQKYTPQVCIAQGFTVHCFCGPKHRATRGLAVMSFTCPE